MAVFGLEMSGHENVKLMAYVEGGGNFDLCKAKSASQDMVLIVSLTAELVKNSDDKRIVVRSAGELTWRLMVADLPRGRG